MSDLNKIKDFFAKKLSYVNEKNFDFFYNLGVDAYQKQDYEKAIKNFLLSLEQNEIKSQVYYNLALTYQCTKNYNKAISTYHKFIELNPNDYDGLYNLGLVYYTTENYKKAIEYFKICVEKKEEKDGIKALTLAYLSNKEIESAIEFSEKILNSSENGLELYYEIATVFENKNSFNKDFTYLDIAIEMFTSIIQTEPKFFEAYLSTSTCYAKKGEWEKAVDYCNKALESNPQSYEANNQMGLIQYCCNNIKEAVKSYETALKLKPKGDYKVYSSLGYAYEKIGRYDKAIKIFTQLISKFPQFPAKDEIKNHIRILKEI